MATVQNQSLHDPKPREITTKPRRSDQVFRLVVTAGGMASLVILGLIALFLSIKGIHILNEERLGFITNSNWEVITDADGNISSKQFVIAAMLVGTFICALIAVIVGVPIAVLPRDSKLRIPGSLSMGDSPRVLTSEVERETTQTAS